MVDDHTRYEDEVRLARQTRDQADRLLRRLIADRRFSEHRHSVAGTIDPLKALTGVSALDGAVADMRGMIKAMDERLRELDGRANPVPVVTRPARMEVSATL